MNTFKKLSLTKIIASILLLQPFFASAAGVDDLLNTKAPSTEIIKPAVPKKETAVPYTQKEIIDRMQIYLDSNDNYDSSQASKAYDKERTEAFNNENFGACHLFAIRFDNPSEDFSDKLIDHPAGRTFFKTIQVLYPTSHDGLSKEEAKARAIQAMKDGIAILQDPNTWSRIGSTCEDHDKYFARYKELLDAVIQAQPAIRAEKQRLALEERQKYEKRQAATEASNKARMDAEIARQEKINTCANSDQYKLYRISANIEYYRTIANQAQQEIDRQNQGAKISGFVDKQVMYNMGSKIAEVDRVNKENFVIYKQVGGTAKNVKSVPALPTNPCAGL